MEEKEREAGITWETMWRKHAACMLWKASYICSIRVREALLASFVRAPPRIACSATCVWWRQTTGRGREMVGSKGSGLGLGFRVRVGVEAGGQKPGP